MVMTVGRLSTYNLHQIFLGNAFRSQENLSTLQQQISSGLKSNNFAGLGSSTEQFADLESRLSRGQGYIDGSRVIEGRLNVMDNALASVIETGTDIKNLIALRRNSAVGDSLAFQTQLEGKWKALVSQLNISFEGRFVFSGTATNTPAVDATDMPVLQADGTPDTGYYQGSNQDISVRIDDNVNIDYNVRADDPAIQKIMAGIAMAKKFGTSAGESAEMQQAYDLVAQGVDGVIGVRAEVNANKVSVISNLERLEALKLSWSAIKGEISSTDIVAASTEVAVSQGILQASFQVFARISSLKLSDFLR